jgi:hypothetical protein
VVVFLAGLVAASPYALRALDPSSRDWERLSWVGQTYGAASAFLAMFALIGIAVSLVIQAREARAAREQSLRVIHTDLLQLAMDDEVYRRAWGPFFAAGEPDAQRQHMYINLIISNLRMQYELRALTEPHLRSVVHIMFSGDPGRRFWAEGRELRMRAAGSRRERRFLEILDEEYRHALASPAEPPAPAPPAHGFEPERSVQRRRRVWWAFAGAVAAGAAACAPIILRAARRARRP